MEELDYWRLCEELNIVQAALLVVSEEPSCAEYVEDLEVHKRPKGYEAAKTAICAGLNNFIFYETEYSKFEKESLHFPPVVDALQENHEYLSSLRSGSIKGVLVPELHIDVCGNCMGYMEGTIDLYKSTVNADSLKQWLSLKGFAANFFLPERVVEGMGFLDPAHSRYAPKLAAAVRAWQAVTDGGKTSPKQALDKWLREHAAEFNLTNDKGQLIEQAISDCSKVANWKQTGGAPKIPG